MVLEGQIRVPFFAHLPAMPKINKYPKMIAGSTLATTVLHIAQASGVVVQDSRKALRSSTDPEDCITS